jgi:hypothetical protein
VSGDDFAAVVPFFLIPVQPSLRSPELPVILTIPSYHCDFVRGFLAISQPDVATTRIRSRIPGEAHHTPLNPTMCLMLISPIFGTPTSSYPRTHSPRFHLSDMYSR